MKKYLILILALTFLQGCQTNPLLDSSIAIQETIIPEYIVLVKESPKYNEMEKKYRIRNAEYYSKVIDAAKKKR